MKSPIDLDLKVLAGKVIPSFDQVVYQLRSCYYDLILSISSHDFLCNDSDNNVDAQYL
jgi:hypothetical protein